MANLTSFPLPALLVTALAALAVSGCSVDLDLSDDTTRRIEERAVAADGIEIVQVTTDNGEVRIMDEDVGEIELRAELIESDEGDADVEVTREGDRLTIDGECDGDGWLDRCAVELRVVVPAELDVSVETSNGAITLDGLRADVDVETDNGAIEGDDLGAARVTAHTDSGKIELSFAQVPEEVEVTTDNGAILVGVPDDGTVYDVDATSDHGSAEIDVPTDRGAGRSIIADSDNGSIDVEHSG